MLREGSIVEPLFTPVAIIRCGNSPDAAAESAVEISHRLQRVLQAPS